MGPAVCQEGKIAVEAGNKNRAIRKDDASILAPNPKNYPSSRSTSSSTRHYVRRPDVLSRTISNDISLTIRESISGNRYLRRANPSCWTEAVGLQEDASGRRAVDQLSAILGHRAAEWADLQRLADLLANSKKTMLPETGHRIQSERQSRPKRGGAFPAQSASPSTQRYVGCDRERPSGLYSFESCGW